MLEEAGADFVKHQPATPAEVQRRRLLMRETVSDALQVKPPRYPQQEGCLKMLEAGADRIGSRKRYSS